MTREAFIRKWLANPKNQYNEQCRDEMRDDLDLVIESALRQPPVSGSLGFDRGYEQGYNDATKEACQEIAKNYQPNDR